MRTVKLPPEMLGGWGDDDDGDDFLDIDRVVVFGLPDNFTGFTLPDGTGAPDAAQLAQFQSAQDGLSSALSRLLVVVERYPELKATQAFRDLQVQLEGTENRIAVERNRYNEIARQFNTARRSFPTILIANFMGFAEKAYFEAAEGAETPPVVEF